MDANEARARAANDAKIAEENRLAAERLKDAKTAERAAKARAEAQRMFGKKR